MIIIAVKNIPPKISGFFFNKAIFLKEDFMTPYIIKKHLTRKATFMDKNDPRVPEELFTIKNVKPQLDGFPYPLPSAKEDYTCQAKGNGNIIWYAGKTGVTRYDPDGEELEDKIMYFSAHRYLAHHAVDAILPDGDGLWALNGESVSHIQLKLLSAEEKAEILLDETNRYVMRRGMVSQRDLKEYRNYESRFPYAACDNDGLFTSGYAVAEMYRYATLKEKLGADHPRTVDARKNATKACEACLLLMFIHGRPEGFIARSYHVTGEPIPDDGIFYKRNGKTATCVKTEWSEHVGRAGEESPCDYPIPDRLAALYRELGYTDDDITYKADTSSDEVTGHFLQMKIAYDFLVPEDPELGELIKTACVRTMNHIIDHGFEFCESSGKPTTWAKWSMRYFTEDPTGYVDAPLNAAEVLMYLKITMHITGEEGKWLKNYNKLIDEGYAELTLKHYDRFFQGAMREGVAPEEDLMYGDNMLALMAFWMLCTMETDEKLLATYREGFKTWSHLILREHTPGYDFMYKLGVPDANIDFDKDAKWFSHFETNRLTSSIVTDRHDVAKKLSRNGEEFVEISALLPPDERFIAKYDCNPYALVHHEDKGQCIESCYIYTFAYWIGRYYGFIGEEE